MFTDTERRSGSFGKTSRRSPRSGRRAGAAVWTAVLAAVAAAGLLAAAPAGAQTPPRHDTVYVHSAASGELGGGRLTLRGVKPRVTWAHNSGRHGVMRVKLLHRRLFPRAKLAATGTLHVAGHRGGDELILKLSKPRYNRAGRTVSYRARPLNNKPLPNRAVRPAAAARRFGAASLSIQGGTGNTLNVDATTTYPGCGGVCWGIVTASGMMPSICCSLEVSVPVPGGNTGQATETDYAADGNGNINLHLNLPCNVPTPVTIEADFYNGQIISNDYNPPFPCG